MMGTFEFCNDNHEDCICPGVFGYDKVKTGRKYVRAEMGIW